MFTFVPPKERISTPTPVVISRRSHFNAVAALNNRAPSMSEISRLDSIDQSEDEEISLRKYKLYFLANCDNCFSSSIVYTVPYSVGCAMDNILG